MKTFALALALADAIVIGQVSARQATDDPLTTYKLVLERQPDDLRSGNDYRVAVMQAGQYNRELAFFQRLVAAHPSASNAHLNYGFAYVDKIPVAGAITQVILANNALTEFSRALELKASWIGLYTRGNSYLFWPRIFKRTQLGVADLQEALKIQRSDKRRGYHARTFVALGDGYWKMDEFDNATATWRNGLEEFPDNPALKARLSKQGDDLKALIDGSYDPNKRVDTSLQAMGKSVMRPALALVVALALAGPGGGRASESGAITFEDITARAGVKTPHHTRRFKGKGGDVLRMFTSGGAAIAVGDYDNDGFDDLFVTDSAEGTTSHLYHNNGNLTFSDVTATAGVGGGNDPLSIVADALWLDYDNDGWRDLLVIRFGTPILYHSEHDGRFKDVSAGSGLNRFGNAIAAIAFDYDNDGRLDLLFGNYFKPVNLLNLADPHVLPNDLDNAVNGGGVTLWRNAGNGRWEDVTEKAGFAQHTGWTLNVGHGDFNNDGLQDVYLACDYGTDRIFFNNGDGTFRDTTRTAIGFDTKKGMNVNVGDYDNDGWLNVYVTNITDEYMRECNMLWHNNGDGTFTDVSRETGTCETLWGWSAKFGDYDNDGQLDLFVVNGLRSAGPNNYIPVLVGMITKPGVDFTDVNSWPNIGDMTWSGYQKKKLFRNLGGHAFKEMSAAAGVDNDRDGRGLGAADFDNDGRLNFFQTNANQDPLLYRNMTGGGNHWAELKLVGAKSNRDAIGARVILKAGEKTMIREVDGGNGYAGQSSQRVHFGLATESLNASVQIRWPSGIVQNVTAPVDRVTTIRESVSDGSK